MWNAHLFGTGQWQWDALKGPPFNALFYTPVWYLIMGRVTNIFGDSLVVGRIFNLLTFAGCLILVFLIVRYFTRSRIYGLIGAALPLMSSYMIAWSMFPRVDMLAILFELDAGNWRMLEKPGLLVLGRETARLGPGGKGDSPRPTFGWCPPERPEGCFAQMGTVPFSRLEAVCRLADEHKINVLVLDADWSRNNKTVCRDVVVSPKHVGPLAFLQTRQWSLPPTFRPARRSVS